MEANESNPLRSDLREAAETMEQALSEACASKPADQADTGELVRVEEMIALAGEAARRAISLRRKARADAESLSGVLEPREGAADASVATHRLFEDARGIRWDVWAVYPEARPSPLSLPGTFSTGWLVFESAAEKRRLSPIPSDWHSLPAKDLEQLCGQADVAPRRTRTQATGFDEGAPGGAE